MTNNGYTEIMINGRKAGLKFNMYAIEQFETIKGRNGNIKNFTTIIWAGILGNAYVKQIEPEFTFEEVCDWLDEQLINGDADSELKRIMEVFGNSRAIKKGNDNNEPDEEAKKKLMEMV